MTDHVPARITMKNIAEVLEQKKRQRDAIQKEVEALEVVIPLLDERTELVTNPEDVAAHPAVNAPAKRWP